MLLLVSTLGALVLGSALVDTMVRDRKKYHRARCAILNETIHSGPEAWRNDMAWHDG